MIDELRGVEVFCFFITDLMMRCQQGVITGCSLYGTGTGRR
jgi:hypothetical protein